MKTRSRTIIVTDADEQMLARIADFTPFASRHRIAQLALRLGLREIAASPGRLVEVAKSETNSPPQVTE